MVGLDISLVKTGLTIIKTDGTVLFSGLIKSKPSGDSYLAETRRLVKIAEDVMEKIDEFTPNGDPALVVIENMAFAVRNTTALTQIAGLSHLVRILLAEFGWPVVLVAPTSLKKFLTGSGKGDKDMVMMSIYKNYGFEAMDNNTADSYGLSVCGLALLGKPLRKLGVPQQEVIKLLSRQL